MKRIRSSLVLFAASVVIAGAAPPQDGSASFHREMLTNSTGRIPLNLIPEPRLDLGPNTRLTGLFVDCAMPRQTWAMLNSSAPAQNLQAPVPPSLLPVTIPRRMNDPAVHEANFALLQLSFP